ncbi:MAG: DnaD domain protein [Tissierellia bacterium]|nr:DnaD domain protein [Tissierellia bacterium]
MSYRIQEETRDFGDTPIENIFLHDFLPSAPGEFVKVYLTGYHMAVSGLSGGDVEIAQLLGTSPAEVARAWDYWELQNVITRELLPNGQSGIIFIRLKELYAQEAYRREAPKEDRFVDSLSNPKIAQLFTKVQYYLRRELPYQRKLDIASWMDSYNMPPELIIEAFRYATEQKNNTKLSYIEAIVRGWADENVRTPEALEENFKKHDANYFFYRKVMGAMGLGQRDFSPKLFTELMEIRDGWPMKEELIMAAAQRTERQRNPNFNYFTAILRNWREGGIEELSQIPESPKRAPKGGKNIDGARTDSYGQGELDELMAQRWENLTKGE